MAYRAGTKGKQPSVQEGSFLLFLRSVGYRDDLPPSTVAWLENAPVFRFLASRLGHDNFVSSEDQQEYNEVMLAKGPNLELYEALGYSASDDEAEDDIEPQPPRQEWLEDTAPADLQQQLQDWERIVQHLEQQIATVRDMSSRVEASVRSNRNQQSKYITLQAQAQQRLTALKADLTKLNEETNTVLSGLADVCTQFTELLQELPKQWLLSAADLSSYQQQDVEARKVIQRAMSLLNAAGVVRELDPAASPAAAPPATPRVSKQGLGCSPLKPGFQSAVTTPQQHKQGLQQQQQQQMALMTPRGCGRTNRAEALLEADVKRHADQEARNAALLRELTRQRLAFKVAYDLLIKAQVAETGVKHQLAAIHDIRHNTGGFARYKKMGPESVSQLSLEVTQLEERRHLLFNEEVPALTEDLARLNDTFIVEGDYDRQLHKMAVASERKQAVLSSLLDTASRHLLLLMVGSQEKQRLLALLEELKQTQNYLEGHVDSIRSRIARYSAVQQSLQQSQHRSNLQPDDSYLMTLMAAADGSLSLTAADADTPGVQQLQQQEQDGKHEPGTPLGAAVTAAHVTPQSARTPGYVPVKQLTDHLQQLADTIQQSSSKLQQLCKDLPEHLAKQAAVDKRLYDLAYPAGQSCAPLVPSNSSSILGTSHGGNSSWGLGSTIGSSAAPSLRSMSVRSANSSANSSSVVGQHPLPLLRVPEVAEHQVALERSEQQLKHVTKTIVDAASDHYKLLMQNKQEMDPEKKILSWFYTNPEKLSDYMTQLREEVAALEMAQQI